MFLLKCITLVATVAFAESAAPGEYARQAPVDLGSGDTLGQPYPSDTVYSAVNIQPFLLAIAVDQLGNVFGQFPDCDPIAASKGAEFYIDALRFYGCGVGTLRYPLCRNSSGPVTIYVKESFISDGEESDNAVVNSIAAQTLFPHGLVTANDVFGFSRIQDPTILQFPQLFIPNSVVKSSGFDEFTVAIQDDGSTAYLPLEVIADPACYSQSSCAVPFLSFGAGAASPYAILQDNCGGTVTIPSGEELNIFSHSRIGCDLFPSSVSQCSVSFAGTGALKLEITYTNFVGNDQCDGFYLGIVPDSSNPATVIDVCQSPPAGAIDIPSGSGEIVLSGSTISDRPKYGFIINISYA